MELNIVIYVVGCYTWQTFHRRPMLEAFAENAEDISQLLVVNPPAYYLSRAALFSRQGFNHGLEKISPNMYLYTPKFFKKVGNKNLYYHILQKKIGKVLNQLDFNESKGIAWIFRPEQIGYLGLAEEQYVLYECYDEYQLNPKTGNPIPGMEKKEMDLLKRANIVFTTSQSLYEKRSQWHPRVHLVPNGADVEFWGTAMNEDADVAPELLRIPHPIIGYPGHISSYIDIGLLEYLAEVRPNWSMVLLGEVANDISLERLKREPNVYLLGRQPYHRLPSFAKGFDVTIQPLIVNEYLHCSEPLTLWEQVAAGNVVVSTDLREIRRLKNIVIIAHNNQEFVSSIDFVLSNDNRDRVKQGIAIARERSWNNITKRAADIFVEEFAG